MLNGIHHLISLVDTLVVQVIEQGIDLGPIVRRQIGLILIQVFEVGLLGHRRFVDVIISRDAVVVGNFSQFFHIVDVVMTDVDIEHDCVAIMMLAFNQVIEIRTNWFECLGQRLAILD